MQQATKKLGQQTVVFSTPPIISAAGVTVGQMEGDGPLADYFDRVLTDTYHGEKTWEKAEQKMLQETITLAVQKAGLKLSDIDYLLAGDLLNQIISANYTARGLGVPFIGLFGACSTFAESIALGAMLIDGGFAGRVVASASSHHNTAERQFRFPNELGVQRPPSAQWTVTGAGSVVLDQGQLGLRVTHATIGKVVDAGEKNAQDMGAAMAPAAADTIVTHLKDTGRQPADYDLIITGDLGIIGKTLVAELAHNQGYELGEKYTDCGVLIYNPAQDTHAGGSGCGCSAAVFSGYLFKEILAGRWKRILLIGTGALHSPVSAMQGESIPGIGHAVSLEFQGGS